VLIGRRILLIISGGIAAYKSLDLIRRMRERGAEVRCVLTRGGAEFITPLAVSALSGNPVYQELFSLTEENEMGHIELARWPDMVAVAPASADIMARMAQGRADDLATAVLLATNEPVLLAPAMNAAMWDSPATQHNIATLEGRGCLRVGPGTGDLACGEVGEGRMAEVADIVACVDDWFGANGPLTGRRALVTSGPTFEPIDPVRYIANRSSGRQGHAIARALARLGAEVDLISGPVALPDPPGLRVTHVETAQQMLDAAQSCLPVDVAVCAAAVADWRVENALGEKLKKTDGLPPSLSLTPNPDILADLSRRSNHRPALVVGFAAETSDLRTHAQAKLAAKGCDWIAANDVSEGSGTFGGDSNAILLLTRDGTEECWPRMTKDEVGERLAERIAAHLREAS